MNGEEDRKAARQLPSLDLPIMHDVSKQDGEDSPSMSSPMRPPGLPEGYPIGPLVTSDGYEVPEGSYLCDCKMLLSLSSWSKNGRKHEKSARHTNACGLPPYVANNTVCPGCGKKCVVFFYSLFFFCLLTPCFSLASAQTLYVVT